MFTLAQVCASVRQGEGIVTRGDGHLEASFARRNRARQTASSLRGFGTPFAYWSCVLGGRSGGPKSANREKVEELTSKMRPFGHSLFKMKGNELWKPPGVWWSACSALLLLSCEATLVGGPDERRDDGLGPNDGSSAGSGKGNLGGVLGGGDVGKEGPGKQGPRWTESATADAALAVLVDACVRCHGGVRELGGLNLLTREGAEHVLGDGSEAESSRLYLRVTSTDPDGRMPPAGDALSPDKIAALKKWLEEGAPWPTHWSLVSLGDPKGGSTSSGPSRIDELVKRRLDDEGVSPSEEASPAELVTRLTLDLTGLPPSFEDVQAFEKKPSDKAYEGFVDRLLASTEYAERSARLWLDNARYSDSDGYEQDQPRYGAFRYRDWVIDAFNRDMPFDEFTQKQLAGDLLPGASTEDLIATAFQTQTLLNREGGADPKEDRVKRIADRVITLGETWLGLTLECAQCHDHPYDPISQREFYALFAFFDQATEVDAEVEGAEPDAPTSVIAPLSEPEPTYVFKRGDFLNPDLEAGPVEPGTPALLAPLEARNGAPDRLDLANWIVRVKNPLALRVRVNALWAQLFGRGLVETPSDFGVRGERPTNRALLDALALRFSELGFRQKALLREIVLSRTYRRSSRPTELSQNGDPEGRILSRQSRFRLDAEQIRDRILQVSGLLSHRVMGPSVFPPLTEETSSLVSGPYSNFVWTESSGEDRYRRGLYTFHKRSFPYPALRLFDWPAADRTQSSRPRSLSPLQALTLLHEPAYVEASIAFANTAPAGSADERIEHLFQAALLRAPREEEREVLRGLYDQAAHEFEDDPDALGLLLGEEANSGTELGALSVVAHVLFNTDEFLTRN